ANDLNARAAQVTSDRGAVVASAGHDVNLTTGEANVTLDEAHKVKTKGFLSSKTVRTRDSLDATTAVATTLSGDTTTVAAGNDLNLSGSNVVSTKGTGLYAGNDIKVTAAENSEKSSHFKKTTKSGLFGTGGIGFTIGTQQQSSDAKDTTSSAAGSTVASLNGDVTIQAGKHYRQTGSDVVALGQKADGSNGNVDITAKNVVIDEARENYASRVEEKSKSSGLTVALSNPVVSAVQSAADTAGAVKGAVQTGGGRMQALAAATAGLAAKNLYDAGSQLAQNPSAAASVGVSITYGESKSRTITSNTATSGKGSQVVAGGDVNIRATGAGADSDLTIQGSQVTAGNDIKLKADDQLNLLAAKNDSSLRSKNSSSSWGAGVAVQVGAGGVSAGITANAALGRGHASGDDTSYGNTHIEAGNRLGLESGGDTTIKGAVASGKQAQAKVGGNLTVESLQDTSSYDSKQQNIGGSVTVGYGGASGSVSAGQQKMKSSYASVREQSGIKAGDGGFQVNVKGNTDLKGVVIASTERAAEENRNSLTTATLATRDIANHAEADTDSIGIALDSSMLTQGKYGAAKAVIGNALNNASASDNSGGQTRSAVSPAAVVITDEAAQLCRTGQTAEQTVAALNRDVVSAHTAATKIDTRNLEKTVEAERLIKQEAVKVATIFTDEAYRESFLEKARVYKVQRNSKTGKVVIGPDGKPLTVELSQAAKLALKPETGGKINVFTNGINNDLKAAAGYAVQMSELPLGQDIYLVYYPEANNSISELLVAGYQKFLEGSVGDLANATKEVKNLMTTYGESGLNLVGHSRGAMTIGNAMESLAKDSGSSGTLSNTSLKFVGPAYNAQDAANLLDLLSNGNSNSVTLQNHVDDFVGSIIGWNPATYDQRPGDSSRVREWVRMFGAAPTVHSCYGTMAVNPKGCNKQYGVPKTVEVGTQSSESVGVKP
ncbi:MAG: adhesin, partial [Rhodocyclaceae bacterium]|nr:adhesin [Rhodocyclaceae bacterium]